MSVCYREKVPPRPQGQRSEPDNGNVGTFEHICLTFLLLVALYGQTVRVPVPIGGSVYHGCWYMTLVYCMSLRSLSKLQFSCN